MATQPSAARAGWRELSTVQMVATLFSVVFVLVGIIGFIPGLTTHLYGGLEFAGDDGNSEILGLFHTSVLHNLVHLLFGAADWIPSNTADDWLHLVLGVAMIALGFVTTRETMAERATV
jgi:hypothetical protein